MELLGDCSRTPIVEKILRANFGDKLRRTLHSVSAITLGATATGSVFEKLITENTQMYCQLNAQEAIVEDSPSAVL